MYTKNGSNLEHSSLPLLIAQHFYAKSTLKVHCFRQSILFLGLCIEFFPPPRGGKSSSPSLKVRNCGVDELFAIGFRPCSSESGEKLYGSLLPSIFLKVIEILPIEKTMMLVDRKSDKSKLESYWGENLATNCSQVPGPPWCMQPIMKLEKDWKFGMQSTWIRGIYKFSTIKWGPLLRVTTFNSCVGTLKKCKIWVPWMFS